MKGDTGKGVDDTFKGVFVMINHDFKLVKEGRENKSDYENVVELMYFRFH